MRFADIDPRTLNIDPKTVAPLVTDRTKAIYVVHYGGIPVDVEGLRALLPRPIPIVEDCAHAVGSQVGAQPIGSGDLCCFSFDSLKNMTGLGGGGMLCTRNETWANEARTLIDVGVVGISQPRESMRIGPYGPGASDNDHSQGAWSTQWSSIEEYGDNFVMTTVQSAAARVQLRKLDGMNQRRRAISERYDAAARACGLIPVGPLPGSTSACHLYTCLVPPGAGFNRDDLIRELQQTHRIRIVLRYFPLHLLSEIEMVGHRYGEAPVCERIWFEQQVNLPISSETSPREVETVVTALQQAVNTLRASAVVASSQ